MPDKVAELRDMIDGHVASGVGARYPYSIQAPVMVDKTLADGPGEDDEYIYWPN